MTPEIDFLPASYREVGVQRKNWTLRAVVVALFVLLVGFAAVYQQVLRRRVAAELAELLPRHEAAQATTARLAELQMQFATVEKKAELATYLRHPWPRSRILSAVAGPLPKSVELDELNITHEQIPGDDEENDPRAKSGRGSEAKKTKVDPAQADLTALREQHDKHRTVVVLTGVTTDASALHEYLDVLAKNRLFTKVDLSSIEQVTGARDDRMRFTVKIIVRPGFGQPHGPTEALDETQLSSKSSETSAAPL